MLHSKNVRRVLGSATSSSTYSVSVRPLANTQNYFSAPRTCCTCCSNCALTGCSCNVANSVFRTATRSYSLFTKSHLKFNKMPGSGLEGAKTFFDEKLASKYTDGNVKEVSVEDAIAKMNDGKAVIIDTRGDEACDISMIKGAMKPEDMLKKLDAGELAGKELITQCYIGGGSCDWIVANKDKLDGKIEATSMKLGLIGAAHAGVPLVDKDGKETKNVHNVGPLKGMFPETHTEMGV